MSSAAAMSTNDSPELEALFDSIVSAQQETPSASSTPPPIGAGHEQGELVSRVGHLTRKLYDTLKELGAEQALENAAAALPDACERLTYVADRTDQAAHRALAAIEAAKPIQDQLSSGAIELGQGWDQFFKQELSPDQFRLLVEKTRHFLSIVPKHAQDTQNQLNEIMMAQDFQDLTGQVIKRVIDTAQEMQKQLLQLLIDYIPQAKREAVGANSLLNGPVINATGKTDVVTNQEQVDELLQSLGF